MIPNVELCPWMAGDAFIECTGAGGEAEAEAISLHKTDQRPCINENARRAACASFLVHPKRDETSAGVNATRHDKDQANETVSLVSFAHAKLQAGRLGSGGSPGGLVKGIMLRIMHVGSPVAW
jgi:hypothetical protein